jgi:hypothetical protein
MSAALLEFAPVAPGNSIRSECIKQQLHAHATPTSRDQRSAKSVRHGAWFANVELQEDVVSRLFDMLQHRVKAGFTSREPLKDVTGG